MRLPSGDHTGLLLEPRARMNGSSPRSTGVVVATGAVSFTRKMFPSRTTSTLVPSGASAGDPPSATRHTPVRPGDDVAPVPVPAVGVPAALPVRPPAGGATVRAAQMARSAPSGLLVGSAAH